MARKPATTESPTEEAPVSFSFMSMVKKSSAELPKKGNQKSGDPLAIAKTAITEAITDQTSYLRLVEEGKPLPFTKKGERSVSTWFTKTPEGYWTGIRYGQLPIPLNGGVNHFIGSAEELKAFYEAVKAGIQGGELDTVIEGIRAKRSAALSKPRNRA